MQFCFTFSCPRLDASIVKFMTPESCTHRIGHEDVNQNCIARQIMYTHVICRTGA